MGPGHAQPAAGWVRQTLASPWTHAAALFAFSLAAWLRAGIRTAPILWDRAYFTYLGQAVLRGEPIYSNSFMGYPPLGPLLSAASMWIGQAFGLPTFLAPRHLAVAVGAGSVALLYAVTRRATGSAWAGALAGIALAGFQTVSASALTTLEPKLLVAGFSLAGCAAVQARRPFAVGTAAALAASCWQPALLVPAALAGVALWNGRGRARRTFAQLCAGGLVGLLPALAYLAATDGWLDFWQRSVLIPAAAELPGAGSDPWRWLRVARVRFSNETFFFLAGGAGFAAYALTTLRRGRRGLASWLRPELGGLPPLTLAWVAFDSIEFGGPPDMLPLLPAVGFWIGWLASRCGALARRLGERLGRPRGPGGLVRVAAVGAALLYGFADGPGLRPTPTLERELELIADIVEPAGARGVVMSFSAEAVYVLSGRRSPLPFLRLTDAFMPLLASVEPQGCTGVLRRILRERPAVVVVYLWRRSSACERQIPELLEDRGYRGGVLSVGGFRWQVLRAPSPVERNLVESRG